MPTTRASFLLRIRPDRLEEYLEAHQHVWADMREALERSGWHNYSLFLHRSSCLVVGYVETDDFDEAQRRMAAEDVNTRWQAAMADFFEPVDDGVRPGQSVDLEEYFHLA